MKKEVFDGLLKNGKKVLISLLSISMLLQPISSTLAYGGTDAGEQSHSVKSGDVNTSGSVAIDNVDVTYDQELVDNGDGTYSLTLDFGSSVVINDLSQNNTVVKYGYYKAEKTGTYLFELWGGNGGDGQDTSYSDGGTGGNGGYVYGTIALAKGDIIFYTLGGNGEQTISNDNGGGANGDGGDHGDTGSYYVGGGGGYSSVYLFQGEDATSFETKYLDASGNLTVENIDETDRLSKYVLIAGGGGGGGAGNAWSLTNKAVRTPDGGDGGNMESSSGVLSGSSYPVEGTYYVGSDGKSSGKNPDDYIGRGGSNLPGTTADTFVSFFEGKEANDWQGTQNLNYPGGSGGAGNLRGGAGGAGFCGGSGGIMTGLLIGTNVGGGGGGSSFIANIVNTPTLAQQEYLSASNLSATGGAINVTLIPDGNYSYMGNINLSGSVSEYFTITNVTSIGTTAGSVTFDPANGTFNVDGFSIMPTTAKEVGESVKIKLTVIPKYGSTFMGGNDVNLVNSLSVAAPSCVQDSGSKTVNIDDTCNYINVPLNFDLETYSYVGNTNPYTEKSVSDLFKDEGYITTNDYYDFISSVTDYTIYDNVNTTDLDKNAALSVTANSTYTISFTVNPKTGTKAVVGDRLTQTTYQKISSITLVDNDTCQINGRNISYKKNLSYDEINRQYIYSINFTTSNNVIATPSKVTSTTDGSYTVPESGFYYIQVWGGNGGTGGEGASDEDGGIGGTGGYVGTYIHLTKGTTLSYTIGANGNTGAKSTNGALVGQQGYGGTKSTVTINSENLVIAGGGGGGGGGALTGTKDGNSVDNSSFGSGTDGEGGYSPSSWLDNSNAKAGANAGTNYKNDTLISTQNSGYDSTGINTSSFSSSDYTNNGTGAVYITCIQLDDDGQEILKDFSLETEFTNHFDVVSASVTGASSDAITTGNSMTITNIDPTITTASDVHSVDFTVTYVLKAKSTFLGGNDVPLIASATLSQTDSKDSTDNNNSAILNSKDVTDYANVKTKDVTALFGLTVNDQTYVIGSGVGVAKTSLYSQNTVDLSAYDLTYVSVYNAVDSVASLSDTLTPSDDTMYPISCGIIPKVATPTKAIVGPLSLDSVLTKNAWIRVSYLVTFTSDNMTINCGSSIDKGDDFSAVISPMDGWLLPDSISVNIGGTNSNDFTYNGTTGEVTILADKITGPVEIIANAKAKTYSIHYIASKDVNGTQIDPNDYEGYDAKTGFTVSGITAGSDITATIDNLLAKYTASPITGYTYTINYPDGSKPTKMSAYDMWITGTYSPNPHTLTIKYMFDSTEIATAYVEGTDTCYYTKEYSVESPQVAGYAPDKVVIGGVEQTSMDPVTVAGTMPDNDLVIYVYYRSTIGKLNVIYNYVNGGCASATVIKDVSIGESYTVDSPIINGYSPNMTTVSGTMADGNGLTVYVIYTPNTYTITFDTMGGNVVSSRNAFYGKEIGYTGVSYGVKTYENLPVPVKVGYKFLGWYTDLDDENTKYTASNIVSGDTLLKAKWEEQKFTVIVKYVLSDDPTSASTPGNSVVSDYVGEDYEIVPITLTGYRAPDKITGTMVAQNMLFNRTYYRVIDLNDYTGGEAVSFEGFTKTYTGSAFTVPEATNLPSGITLSSTVIKDSNDATVTEIKNVGTYTVTKSFTSSDAAYVVDDMSVTCTVNPATKDMTGVSYSSNVTKTYTGSAISITEPTNLPSDVTLTGTTIKDSNNNTKTSIVDADTYTVTYSYTCSDSNYTVDDITITVVVEPKETDMSGVTYTQSDITYTGSTITTPLPTNLPSNISIDNANIVIKKDGNVVTEIKDAGDYTVTVPFTSNDPNYKVTSTKEVSFKVEKKDLSTSADISIDTQSSLVYDKDGVTPTVIVKDGDITLVLDTDYTVSYSNNTSIGSAIATVTFKGNYNGSKDKNFTITPKDMTGTDITANTTYEYKDTPDVTIYDEGTKLLVKGTDYTLSYTNNDKVGENATITVYYSGNYSGSGSKMYTVSAKNMSSAVVTLTPNPDYVAKDGGVKPLVTVKDGEYTLVEGTDYDLTYGTNETVGTNTGEVTVTYKGNYSGSVVKNFDIESKSMSNVTVDTADTEFGVDPVVTVKDGSTTLTLGTDYTLSFSDDDSVGTGKVKVTFIGHYAGNEKNDTFNISVKNVTDADITLDPTSYTYDPDNQACEPSVSVKVDNRTLTLSTDYTVSYSDNDKAGTAKATITFKGNYDGTLDKNFTISKHTLVDSEVTIGSGPFEYTGSAITPSVTVKVGNTTLTKDTDYTVTYTDNVNAGDNTGKIEVSGIGNYDGTINKTFTITAKTIDKNKLSITLSAYTFDFTGSEVKPSATVEYDGKTLIENTDYTLSYTDNVNSGTGHAKVTFINNYSGEETKDFTITIDPTIISISLSQDTYTYSGNANEPTVTVECGSTKLIENTDYTLTYENNVNAGTATAKVTFIGAYSIVQTKTKDFTINALDASKFKASHTPMMMQYDPLVTEYKPTVTVKNGTVTLVEGIDYTVSYSNYKSAGLGSYKITYQGNYSGKKSVMYMIGQRALQESEVSITPTSYDYSYDSAPYKPTVEVVVNGVTLEKGTSYTVSYEDCDKAGTGKVIVKGIGNYMSQNNIDIVKNYTINQKDMSSENAVILSTEDLTYVYGGVTPDIEVKDGTYTLVKDTDYTLSYTDNDSAGPATVTITYQGNYKGTKDINFTVLKKTVNESDNNVNVTLTPTSLTYDPSNVAKPSVKVEVDGHELVEGTDYDLTYSDNDKAGTGKVEIKFKNDYEGTIDKTFEISKKTVSNPTITITPSTVTFDPNNPSKPNVKVQDGSQVLFEGIDYTVTYEDNDEAGTAKAKVTFIGNYSGSGEESFTITKLSVTDPEITISPNPITYDPNNPVEPDVTVKVNGKELEEGKDYELVYSDNDKSGTGKVEIKFKGNYEGSEEKTFDISKMPVTDPEITITPNPIEYDPSNPVEPQVKIEVNGKELEEGKDYEIRYEDNDETGKGKVIIEYKGNYQGNDEEEFTIEKKTVTDPEVTITPNPITYDPENPSEPQVEVKVDGKLLEEGKDYELKYSDNENAGEGKVEIIFKGNYEGEVTETFDIESKEVTDPEITITPDPIEFDPNNPVEPKVEIVADGKTLKEGEDYELKYSDNEEKGTGKVVIEYKGNYKGKDEAEFTIKEKEVTDPVIRIVPNPVEYDPNNPVEPKVEIIVEGKTLVEGEDYELKYSDNEGLGKGKVEIEYKGNYKGKDETEFTIKEKNVTDPTVIITPSPITYDPENPAKPSVKVEIEGTPLFEGIDYTIEYSDNDSSGLGKVTIKFMGKYEGEIVRTFEISPIEVIDPIVTLTPSEVEVVDGKVVEPEVTITSGDKTFTLGVDYTVTYSVDEEGNGVATIKFIGNYSGEIVKTYKILNTVIKSELKDGNNSICIIESEDGFDSGIVVVVEVVVDTEAETYEGEYAEELENILGRFEVVGKVYDIKIYKNGVEIQPSDLAPGTILTVKMLLPDEAKDGNFTLLHIHNDDEITTIVKGTEPGIGTYIIDEEGYLVTKIEKLSEFVFVYEKGCFAHWILLIGLILYLVYLIIARRKNEYYQFMKYAVLALVLVTIGAALICHCEFCLILVGVNLMVLISSIIKYIEMEKDFR